MPLIQFFAAGSMMACEPVAEDGDGSFPPTEWAAAIPVTGDAEWYVADPAADPSPSHQPSAIDCGPAGWKTELGELEINTNYCNYAWLAHDLEAAWPRGAKFTGTLRHFDLTAPLPTSTHARLFVNGEIAADWEIPIQGGGTSTPAAVLPLEYVVENDIPAGANIALHLHNHGQNNYALSVLQAAVPSD